METADWIEELAETTRVGVAALTRTVVDADDQHMAQRAIIENAIRAAQNAAIMATLEAVGAGTLEPAETEPDPNGLPARVELDSEGGIVFG